MRIDHLSVSQINTYLRCPMQYYFRYCEGIISPPSAALTLGLSFHVATAFNYSHKLVEHSDADVDDVCDVFSTEYDERKHETVFAPDENPGRIKDNGVRALRFYHQQVAPRVEPAGVEEEFRVKLKGRDYELVGRIDVIDKANKVIETKTTSRSVSKPRDEHTLQATAYVAAALATGRAGAGDAVIDYAVVRSRPTVASFAIKVGPERVRYLLNLIARVTRAIESEVWIPQRNSFLCSERYCGYWEMCHKIIGG